MRRPTLIAVAALVHFALPAAAILAQGTPTGFLEQFALASDRRRVLEQLPVGSEDYYYYACLERQQAGAFGEVPPLLAAWIQRYGRTGRVEEIENRQALLGFARDPAATYAFLRERLGVRFDAERQSAGAAPDLPTKLDPEVLSPARLAQRALQLHPGSVDGFAAAAFDAVAASQLDEALLMSLLKRLQRPDLANLPALVARNLQDEKSGGFGSLSIHRNLLLDQLEELVHLSPELLNESRFVDIYLRKLAPGPDVQWQRDPAARQAYLDRLWAFAQRLLPSHNSLKAHVLYQRLKFDLSIGVWDKQRFMDYLRLPRQSAYVNPEYLQRRVRGDELVDAGSRFPTGFLPIGDDEPLVRSYLQHHFAAEDDYRPYVAFVQEAYCKRLFAETRILLGKGDMETWYSMLDPAAVEQLKQRVEIAFPPTQPIWYGAGDPVGIDVDLKNVDKLLVKVFAIDTFAFERDTQKEVDATIDLDGMVANEEQTFTYDDNPLRRVRRHFDFPILSGPGTYVVEFLGNGLSSRAVIRKGRLQYLARTGSAGQVLTVLDEDGDAVPDAKLWCGGQQYAAEQDGSIYLPFAPERGQEPLILRHGKLTSLDRIDHLDERYELSAGVFVDREALLWGARAKLLVRPTLTVHGVPVALSLLQQPELSIVSMDQDGIASTLLVRDLKLAADAELVAEIAVPERLVQLSVSLHGKVKNLSQGKEVELVSSPVSLPLNGIAATAATNCPLLSRNQDGWFLEVRGKNGEVRPEVAVHLSLRHRDYTDRIEVELKTDGSGRIGLGALPGIVSMRTPTLADAEWRLRQAACSYARIVTGIAGETLRVPYLGMAQQSPRAAVSLLEVIGGAFVRDAMAHVAITGGFVELRGLPAGDYDLRLKEQDQHILVRVTAGEVRSGWAVGRDRALPLSGRRPLQITGIAVVGQELRVQLANADPATRVHLFATRYLAPFDPCDQLLAPPAPLGDSTQVPHPESLFQAGRAISDEYRYVLDRRYQQQHPGNMLRRPGLILNPWEVSQSENAEGLRGGKGEEYSYSAGRLSQASPSINAALGSAEVGSAGRFADLGFLPQPAPTLANLRADAQGVVHCNLADLGQGQLVYAVAIGATDTVYRTTVLQEQPLQPRDQTLAGGLDPARHFTEQRRLEYLAEGAQTTIAEMTTSTVEQYGTLAKVFQLLQTLSGDPELPQFAFLVDWPQLGDADKLRQYSQHACHEVNFFLYEKDRAFFDRVVRPFLANKADKTFLDHWLLGDDLGDYLRPWAFAQLNVVEQILLTRRLPDERDAGARRVREQFELLPQDQQQLERLFQLALAGRALETDRGLNTPGPDLKLVDPTGQPLFLPPRTRDIPDSYGKPGNAPPAEPEGRAKEAEKLDQDKAGTRLRAAAEKQTAGGDEHPMYFGAELDAAKREQVRQLYRPPGQTLEYAENNYWHVPVAQQDASLITVNGFWRDFALAPSGAPFGSTHLAEAAGSLSEVLMALAVLDLPFTAEPAAALRTGNRVELTAKTPLLLVKKEIRPAEAGAAQGLVLISQDFYRLDARYRYEGNAQLDNFVRGEFLSGVAYGCQVVLTNPTSQPRRLDLLLQIPRGALPVQNGFYTRGTALHLAPFATASFDYAFYFPAAGDFAHYPAHVARDGALVASAPAVLLHVVPKPTVVDTASWEHVSQDGSVQEMLSFLDEHNLGRLDLSKIAWRLREAKTYQAVIGKLRARLCYQDQLWSYGLLQQDAGTVREWLGHQDAFLQRCGRALVSPLLTIDPVERRSYQRIEFDPLFHSRAHRLGRQRVIQNGDLAQQYLSLLDILQNGNLAGQYLSLLDLLAYTPQLSSDDWMSVTYYLLLQDRIDEGLAAFQRVDATKLATKLQYDYLRCYLDFFTDDHKLARSIAEPYRTYPVQRWQQMFTDVLNQLDEAEGKKSAASNPDDRTQRQTELAATEPGLELSVEARKVTLRYQNLSQCTVSYYKLDVEFSFSTNPFVQQGNGAFAYIQPNRSDAIALPAGQKELTFDLPQDYLKANVMIEVSAHGITRRQTYLSNTLSVQMIESYGQLQVTQAVTGKQLSRVYVKVYAKLANGQVRFHKDGYTDLRGRFDYASVSEKGTEGAVRFAILVLSDTDGASIREVAPPGQ